MRKVLLTLLTVICCTFLSAQNRFFVDAGSNKIITTSGNRVIIPQKYRSSTLDMQQMKTFLWSLPAEKNLANRNTTPIMELPMPDGKMARFHVWESSIQEAGLEAKFPDMKTFAGQGIDDPYATIRFDYTPSGFHAQVLTINGSYYIDPYARGEVNNYISYFRTDFRKTGTFLCEVPENPSTNNLVTEASCRGTDLRTYRLAVACTGEYAQAPGIAAGANPATLHAAILTSVNRVVGVYEKEVSVRMILVANNNLVEYLDAATDPFTGNSNANTLINESQTVIDANIGTANYDIGHTFSTGGGGLAQLRSPCGTSKARGITGSSSPTGDAYDIDYVAHEMGHQFGGNHSFNGQTGNCSGGNRNGTTAYEPGSGTTIQAYAGICGTDNIQPNSDPYFHAISFDEISNFVITGNGNTCGVSTPTGNNVPIIDPLPNNGLSIPVNTPFTLTGSATDPDGDAISYNWEQWDLGPQGAWNSGATSTTAPNFKSRVPKSTGSRTFPDIAVILAGYPANPSATMAGLKGETLPTVARPMKFRLTVRDNRAGGGGLASSGNGGCQNSAVYQINAVSTSSPFAVSSPNGGESFPGGTSQTFTWDVVGTDQAPFNVTNVKISLSTDGGLTYPTVITASTPNDGSELLTMPAVVTTTARIKVEAIGNIFFDISNANFTITVAPNGFVFDSPAPVISAACPAAATLQTTLTASYTGTFSTPINLTSSVTPTTPVAPTVTLTPATLQTGTLSTNVAITNANLLSAGSYTVTVTGTAGAIIVTRNITFTINATGGPVIATQPLPQTLCAGGNATFTVAATGTYQWQVSTVAVPAFTNIGGATSATLNVNGVTTAQSGNQYRCVVSNQCGSTNSNAVALTVNTPPVVTTNPQSITLCVGSNNTFTVAATGTALTYQWQVSTTAIPAFTDIPTATSASYTINGITAGMNANQYRCVVSGTCTPSATSNAASLTVVTAVTITSNPTNATVCDAGNTSFTVAGSGSGIIYQWQVNSGAGFVNLSNTAPYSGTTSATLVITGVTPAMSGYQYRAQLSNATCTTPGVSNAATLTVNTLPAISTNPVSATICVGSNNTFSVTASGTGVTYQWQVSTTAVPAFTDIPAATAASYTASNVTATMNGNQYRCVVSGTCPPPVNSAAATLTVISPVVITTQPINTQLCSGSNTSFTVAATSSQTISYQWQVSTAAVPAFTNIPGATAATLALNAVPAISNGNQYRVLLSNTTCTAPVTSATATLTVRQLPTVGLSAAPLLALLPGQTTLLTATPSAQTVGTLTTSWFKDGAAIVNTGNTRTVNIENTGTYRVTIQEVFTGGLTCSNQSPDVVITATVSNKLFIFPSPNNGQFTVSYYNNAGTSTTRSVTIYDNRGSRVSVKTFTVTGPYTLLSMDLRTAQKGLYYVVVGDAAGKKLAEGKVVIQ